mgnify:CR=1 FL=1
MRQFQAAEVTSLQQTVEKLRSKFEREGGEARQRQATREAALRSDLEQVKKAALSSHAEHDNELAMLRAEFQRAHQQAIYQTSQAAAAAMAKAEVAALEDAHEAQAKLDKLRAEVDMLQSRCKEADTRVLRLEEEAAERAQAGVFK